jgi:general secretion pathway protein E
MNDTALPAPAAVPAVAFAGAGAQPRLCGRPLGEILVHTAGLSPERLEEALAAQRGEHAGVRLGEILVRMKALGEEAVLQALALQLELPFLATIDPADASGELAKKVPINFAKSARVLPLGPGEGGATRVAVADPLDTAALDNLALLLGTSVEPVVAPPQAVLDAINGLYDRAVDEHDRIMEGLESEDLESVAHELEEPTDLLEADDEAPIIRLVNSLLFRAVKERASDVHINPEERDLTVRYRIDGELREVIRPPKRIQAALASRIKIMGGLNIAEKRLPQDGRIRIKIAGKDVDIRLSTVPTSHGERIVMRLLDKSNVLLDLTSIGFEPWQLKIMDGLITRSHGIVLVTGPTGSGKTTTLYAALSKINSPNLNILTIEDPVEIQLKGVGQVQVNPKIELTFASGLRSFLRQDPDVILVGEIRDLETAEIAIQASLTGHLVFSTLHTNDAAGAVTRLADMGVQPFLVASSMVGILAQRLIRVLCPECKKPYTPTDEELALAGITPRIMEQAGNPKVVYRAQGCPACQSTGYQGRTGIYELMLIDDDIRQLILKNVDSGTIKKAAVARGMLTLLEHGASKVARGITTAAEVLSVTAEDLH